MSDLQEFVKDVQKNCPEEAEILKEFKQILDMFEEKKYKYIPYKAVINHG